MEFPDNVHPLIRELFKLLPEPGQKWSDEEQATWLAAMSAIFNVLYEDADPAAADGKVG